MNKVCECLYTINQKKDEFMIEPGNQKNKNMWTVNFSANIQTGHP